MTMVSSPINLSKPDPTDDPFGFLQNISTHVSDDRRDLYLSIQNRLEFLDSDFKTTRGTISDRLQRQGKSLDLLYETLQMFQAYLEIVRQEDSA